MSSTLRVGILAGESSGDILGAGLMQALRERRPDIEFRGIGGDLMAEQGLQSRVPIERLSVMGLVEPLKRLPELLRIRREIVAEMQAWRPDVFIGIDYPEFNLSVELRLRAAGIHTVHYVSPSVWAWRRRRIHKIKRAVDLVLALFPFEAEIYREHGVPVSVVGHPPAELIPMELPGPQARERFALPPQAQVLAVLPGSRLGEVQRLAPVFLATAQQLLDENPGLHVLLPCAGAALKAELLRELGAHPPARLHLLEGQSREAMAASDAVLLASGTAALEAMLLKRPMLVCYRLAPVSYFLISRMLRVPYFSLPNLLAGAPVVEELVQNAVTAGNLVPRLRTLLQHGPERTALQERFMAIHRQLHGDANAKAAEAILDSL